MKSNCVRISPEWFQGKKLCSAQGIKRSGAGYDLAYDVCWKKSGEQAGSCYPSAEITDEPE